MALTQHQTQKLHTTIEQRREALLSELREDVERVRRDRHEEVLSIRNPQHVHQPLIQSIVDELRGRGRCESTGESGARASWVMDRLLETYRRQ